jgi:hypothetical protein
MSLGLTQPLTERIPGIFLGSEARPAPNADNLTATCEPIFYKMSYRRHITTLWACTACYRVSFTFYSFFTSVAYCHVMGSD